MKGMCELSIKWNLDGREIYTHVREFNDVDQANMTKEQYVKLIADSILNALEDYENHEKD